MRLFSRSVVMKDGEYLVLYERRHGKCAWNFPGGKVENGETFLDAAKRELREETNLVANDLRLIYENDFVFHDYYKECWHGCYFICNVDDWNIIPGPSVMQFDFVPKSAFANLQHKVPQDVLSQLK